MKDTRQPSRKSEKQFLFEISLNWLSKQKGILTADDVAGMIHVATPPVFGGEGREWSPEHLFLGAVSSCFMTTYLVFAKKLELNISRFECDVTGHVQLIEGRYQFTQLNVYPKIYVTHQALKEKAELALQKTQKYCLVSNSIKAEIIYHGEVLEDLHRWEAQ